MRDGLAFWIQAVPAVWIGWLSLRLGFRSRRALNRRPFPGVVPAGEGRGALAALLASAGSNVVARDRVQSRLKDLAKDLAALGAEPQGAASTREIQERLLADDPILAAFFAENPYTSGRRKDPAFLARARTVVEHLEPLRNPLQGDPL